MELVIDARYISTRPSGIDRYALNLLIGLAGRELPRPTAVLVRPEVELPAAVRRAETYRLVPTTGNPRGPADQALLPVRLRRWGTRLLHSLDAYAPVLAPCRTIVTVYDLIPIRFRHLLPYSRKARHARLWKAWLRWQCRRATAVMTISRHAAGDIAELLGVEGEKINVVLPGILPCPAGPPLDVRRRLSLSPGRRYVLFVGRQEAYKNLAGLIDAFARVRAVIDEPPALVIAGAAHPRCDDLARRIERLGLGEAVRMPGHVGEAELGAIYRQAAVLVLPSFCEGFGLPPLEAMSVGTPTIVSNRTSLPEAVGDGAVIVDPDDTQALADAMVGILTDPDLAAELGRRGRARAAELTVARQAEETIRLYRRVLG